MIKYAYGGDISFKNSKKHVVGFMGLCDTKEQAALARKTELHPSFPDRIYAIDTSKKVENLTICFGPRQGSKVSGYAVINDEGNYFDIL